MAIIDIIRFSTRLLEIMSGVRLAIMQPYFFPYIGYYQLIRAVDRFVFYDDVNFIKNGWINRNRIVVSGKINYITVPLRGASPFSRIKDITIDTDPRWRKKMLASIHQSYSKAPFYEDVFELARSAIDYQTINIAELAARSVIAVLDYLSLSCDIRPSSEIYGNADLKGEDRVIDICVKEDAATYVNLPAGRHLYNSKRFLEHGIGIKFIEPLPVTYKQNTDNFIPSLSIIDVLMFNDKNKVAKLLEAFELN